LIAGVWQPQAWAEFFSPVEHALVTDNIVCVRKGKTRTWKRAPNARLSWKRAEKRLAFEIQLIMKDQAVGAERRQHDIEEARRIQTWKPNQGEAQAILPLADKLIEAAERYESWWEAHPQAKLPIPKVQKEWLDLLSAWITLEKALRALGFGPNLTTDRFNPNMSALYAAMDNLTTDAFLPPLHPAFRIRIEPDCSPEYPSLADWLPPFQWSVKNLHGCLKESCSDSKRPGRPTRRNREKDLKYFTKWKEAQKVEPTLRFEDFEIREDLPKGSLFGMIDNARKHIKDQRE